MGREVKSAIRAFGPGLEGGMCNLPADFTVETNGEVGALGRPSFSLHIVHVG